MNVRDLRTLTPQDIEDIEKLTLRWLFQAAIDFGMQAHEVFFLSPDDVKDIAEDVTREMLDSLPGFNVAQRIYGTVDYKRARYIILPEMTVRQALFTESKAEKERRTATVQMSQTSMRVRQYRQRTAVDEQGLLPRVYKYGEEEFLTTTAFLHFHYSDDEEGKHHLQRLTLFCIPNGALQDIYNPDADDTFWLAGRNAPTLAEDFRVRVSFERLKAKCNWRVQQIEYDSRANTCVGMWEE